LALVAVSLVASSILCQPILSSYVETGSTEPTLEPGDGFVAIPAELPGPINDGDVIVFEAEAIQVEG
jgi:signal peptidase